MAGTKKNRRQRKRFPLVGTLFIAAAFALNVIVALAVLTTKKYDVTVGEPAKERIVAARTVVDAAATETLENAARDKVETIYAVDSELAGSLLDTAKRFFSSVLSLRKTADELREGSLKTPDADAAEPDVPAPEDAREWQDVLPEAALLALTERLPVPVSDAEVGYALLDATDAQIALLETTVTDALSQAISGGLSEDGLSAARAAASRDLQITSLPTRLKTVGELVYDACLQATVVADEDATSRARAAAAEAVDPVRIARGAVIAEKGAAITSGQMAVLLSLGAVSGVGSDSLLALGVAGMLFCAYAALYLFLRIRYPELLLSNRYMLLLLLILCLTLLVAWGCSLIDARILPAALAVLLCAVLIDEGVALAVNFLLAFSLSMLAAGGGASMLGSDAYLAFASTLLSGLAVIRLASHNERRSSLVAAGAAGGGAAAAIVLFGSAMLSARWTDALLSAGIALFTPLVLSVFCVGMLPVWENAFDLATAARLHELQSGNHPLLKKLMLSAPGTYHHSMMTASLAEAAAEQVGASALLARAGGMYHDVGKLRRPLYFMENQNGQNIHDTLPPEESAGTIIAHVKDAEQILLRFHVPGAIRQIAREHHGTTQVAYFYFKAKKQYGDEAVDESQYRYPGPRPGTRESAIVMLADSCEAAVRSLNEPSADEVAGLVHKVIRGKLEDGQLALCPLTMLEIDRIEKSFLVSLGGLMHERIRYPGQPAQAEKDGEA